MITAPMPLMWLPAEPHVWTRRAYGRKVVLETDGGSLRTVISPELAQRQIYLDVHVTGRMLLQLWCNGVMLHEALVSNTDFDCFVSLPAVPCYSELTLDLDLIPATFGTARIARMVELTQPANCLPEGLPEGLHQENAIPRKAMAVSELP